MWYHSLVIQRTQITNLQVAKTQVKLQQIQRQALSPLQKLSGELLELPSEALEERIEKEIQDNPYLEEEESEYSKHYF